MPIQKNKIEYTLDLESQMDELDIRPGQRKTAAEAVGTFIVQEILGHLDKENSPVRGQSKFKGLSTDYKEIKKKQGKGTAANLQLTDAMLNSLNVIATKSEVKLKIKGTTEKKKAFNHNTGDTLPKRQFLPDDSRSEVFKRKVTDGVKKVLEGFSNG